MGPVSGGSNQASIEEIISVSSSCYSTMVLKSHGKFGSVRGALGIDVKRAIIKHP